MMKQTFRSAAILIGGFCILGRAGAEPAQTGQPSGPAATNVPIATQQQQDKCTASTGEAVEGCDSMLGTMMEYQKAVTKEAREDRRMQAGVKRRALETEAAKITLDNKAIDAGMQESREKALVAQQGTGVVQPVPGLLEVKPPSSPETTVELCKVPPCE